MEQKIDITNVKAFGENVDFGKTASDYQVFRAGFPTEFFDRITADGYVQKGHRALDIGTGTGTVARGLALAGMNVTGVDPAASMLQSAAMLDKDVGVHVTYKEGPAEKLSEEENSFELVTAGQCWHWFDRPKAAAEVARVLVPGGRIIIAHFDWLPLAGNMVEATEKLILKFNPDWALSGGNGFYPDWLSDLAGAGFERLETFSFDIAQSYSHEAWRGRIRASAGVKASLNAEETQAFDDELASLLANNFPDDPLLIPHRVWAVTGIHG